MIQETEGSVGTMCLNKTEEPFISPLEGNVNVDTFIEHATNTQAVRRHMHKTILLATTHTHRC